MSTYNETQIANAIEVEIQQRLENYKLKVMSSTGSYHDKNDVCNLLEDVLSTNLVTFIMDTLSTLPKEVKEDNEVHWFSGEMIREAFDKMSFSNYVTIDNDSAEFQLNYNNQVELNDVEFEFDDEEMIEDLDDKLMELLNKHNNQ